MGIVQWLNNWQQVTLKLFIAILINLGNHVKFFLMLPNIVISHLCCSFSFVL